MMIIHRHTRAGWLPPLDRRTLRPLQLHPRDFADAPIGSTLVLTPDGWLLRWT